MVSKTQQLDEMVKNAIELSKERERSKNQQRVDEILNSSPGGKSHVSCSGSSNDKLEIVVVDPVTVPLAGKFKHKDETHGGDRRKWSTPSERGLMDEEEINTVATVSNKFSNRQDSLSEEQQDGRELLKNLTDQKVLIQLAIIYKDIVDEQELTVIAKNNDQRQYDGQTSHDDTYSIKFSFPSQKIEEVRD